MIQSNFREWTLDRIEETFGLVQVRRTYVLDELVSYHYELDDYQTRYLNDIAEKYISLGGDSWNEVELENKMISPIIVFSDIDNKQFAYFLERPLSVEINDYALSGRVDGMIATGFRNPKKPYFCMAEYKRATDPDGDPSGQALIAMLAAQHMNDNQTPIFGCYIIGRNWYFMALVEKEYAISNVYACTNDGIFAIFRILKGLRWHIEQLIK